MSATTTAAAGPTRAPAGSEAKIRVMEERARLRLPLFHPEDNTAIDRPPSRQTGGGIATRDRRVPGVRRHGKKWRVRIWIERLGREVSVPGVFDSEEEAGRALAEARRLLAA